MLSLKIQKLFDSFSNSGRKITGKNISLKTKFNYKVINYYIPDDLIALRKSQQNKK